MQRTKLELWERYQKYYSEYPSLGLSLDLSRVNFEDSLFDSMREPMAKAFAFMAELEKGAIANPDEKRMVGHYWLRNPALAPKPEIRREIEETLAAIKSFTADVHGGRVRGAGGNFKHVLIIGIGGSALGPQFVSNALGHPKTDKMSVHFFDNTDPDGMDKVLASLDGKLNQTLCVVISKSGGTKETRNGMLEAQEAYKRASLDFAKHAVAVTGAGSELDKTAAGWIRRFPMWDWVGGRTSETSAVGLLPAALQGLDIDGLLSGAKACDELTRKPDLRGNPAALLALMWHYIGNGRGQKDMVILPYKDRLELLAKYLQQLVMESLGKELDLDGKVVNQGLSVFGNKGSTDQHAYIQQLRDGLNNFFVTFIRVLKDRAESAQDLMVEADISSGDYLQGFLLGTREALFEKERQSITITLTEVSPFSVGVIIALFERVVGLYAQLIHINAYHQPGVEAGKKAAGVILDVQKAVLKTLRDRQGQMLGVGELASLIGKADSVETVYHVCEHLAANKRGIERVSGARPGEAKYRLK